jgi:uncharacterized protein YecE (DUF72 family)
VFDRQWSGAPLLRGADRILETTVIRIGPAGWSYKDWAGIVYPNPLPKGFSQVEFLSKLFDTIEINTSFYGPPNPHMTRR